MKRHKYKIHGQFAIAVKQVRGENCTHAGEITKWGNSVSHVYRTGLKVKNMLLAVASSFLTWKSPF